MTKRQVPVWGSMAASVHRICVCSTAYVGNTFVPSTTLLKCCELLSVDHVKRDYTAIDDALTEVRHWFAFPDDTYLYMRAWENRKNGTATLMECKSTDKEVYERRKNGDWGMYYA